MVKGRAGIAKENGAQEVQELCIVRQGVTLATENWRLELLGDRAVLAICQKEVTAQHLAEAVRRAQWPGVLDVVVAYHSVAVHVDRFAADFLPLLKRIRLKKVIATPRLHHVPCCYEMGEDLDEVASQLMLTPQEVVEHHTSMTFSVFAVGFSPGFPYLGWLPRQLRGISRRQEPRLTVPSGSVALVGKQSAIYPQATPGGWALIGRTPIKLVDVHAGYFPIKAGDQVKFESISREEFRKQAEELLR